MHVFSYIIKIIIDNSKVIKNLRFWEKNKKEMRRGT
jgi:hypothetical protein